MAEKGKITLLVLLLGMTACFAQQKLKKADRLFNEYAYVDAAKAYEEYLEQEKNPEIETLLNAAEANYNIGNTGKAVKLYKIALYRRGKGQLMTEGNPYSDKHIRNYIHALKAENNHAIADVELWRLLAGDSVMLDRFLKQKTRLDSINGKYPAFEVHNLAVNSDKADFGTAFYGDKVVFSSGRDTVKGRTYEWNKQPFLALYVADRNPENGALVNEIRFIHKEQTVYHNATLSFTPDLKTVYYTASRVNRNDRLKNSGRGTNNFGIIRGRIAGDKLADVLEMPFNSDEHSVGHPALSPDGKWLYFVSDMPGGYGETDIYAAQVFDDGRIGEPVNAGPVINTPGREMFPFVGNGALYFSSDGHYGMGGLDVFKSKIEGALQFSEPENMGSPVNSNRDDFAFIIEKQGKYGYFSSNRAGGLGDDDIYYFTKSVPCRQTIAGKVLHERYNIPINGADVTVTDATGKSIAAIKTKEDGAYIAVVPCNTTVTVEATKQNHTKDTEEVATGSITADIKDIDLALNHYDDLVTREGNIEKIDINPIYFDFDQYYITPQAAVELDKVVYVMKNFSDVIIKIESHTDSRGEDDYNLRLSDDRAKSTYSYIISKGIEPGRIESVKGYGETQLRNQCSNGAVCTEEEHQLNRRSDFIVVKK